LDKAEKSDKSETAVKSDKLDKSVKGEKVDLAEQMDKSERTEKPASAEKTNKQPVLGSIAAASSPSKKETQSNTLANASSNTRDANDANDSEYKEENKTHTNGDSHRHSHASHAAIDAHHFPQPRKSSQKFDEKKHLKDVDTTADGFTVSKARSVRSTASRKSKWGNDDAEPLGEVLKRQWLEVSSPYIYVCPAELTAVPRQQRCSDRNGQSRRCRERLVGTCWVGRR